MKRFLALILSAVLLVGALAGCGNGGEKSPSGDGLEGVWHAEMDMSEAVNERLAAGGMGEFVTVSDFPVTRVLTLNGDGTYTMTVDKDALTASLKGITGEIKDGVIAYMEEMIEERGLNISVDEAMASVDVDSMVDQVVGEEAVSAMADSMTIEGRYEAEDGKLYASGSLDTEPGSIYEAYTLNGDTLTLDKGNGEFPSALESLEQFMPIAFTRV